MYYYKVTCMLDFASLHYEYDLHDCLKRLIATWKR